MEIPSQRCGAIHGRSRDGRARAWITRLNTHRNPNLSKRLQARPEPEGHAGTGDCRHVWAYAALFGIERTQESRRMYAIGVFKAGFFRVGRSRSVRHTVDGPLP